MTEPVVRQRAAQRESVEFVRGWARCTGAGLHLGQLKHDTAERLPTSDTILSKRGLSPGPSRQHLSDKRSRSDGSAPVDQHQSAAGEELNASPTWDHQLSTDDKYCVQIQTMLSAHCDDTWYSAGPCPHSESVGSELVQIEACIP